MIIDFHTHSSFSKDSKADMEKMIEGAIKLGVTHMAFTDHIDYDYDEDGAYDDWIFDLDDYFNTLEAYKKKYHNKINLFNGVELGIQPHIHDKCNQLLQKYEFDFIIASLHTVFRKDLYNKKFFLPRSAEESMRIYYDEYYQSLKGLNDFSVLGHLDLYVRYWEPLKEEPISKYFDQLEIIFEYIIEKERGIEVNSGGYFKYNLMRNNPCDEILKFYKEMGGEVLTIGSDAHSPENIGTLYKENLKKLYELGFKYICTFERMKPNYHLIQKML